MIASLFKKERERKRQDVKLSSQTLFWLLQQTYRYQEKSPTVLKMKLVTLTADMTVLCVNFVVIGLPFPGICSLFDSALF